MAEFPKQIDCGGFELIKPEATFDKAKEFFDIVTKNKEFLAEWLEWVGLYTQPEVAFNYLNSISDVKEPSYLIQVNGKVIGGHGFVDVNERYKIAEIGYWLAPEFNGCGFVTRGIHFLENFAFGKCGMNRLQIKVDTENIKSQAVAVRAGYKKEGVLRHGYILY
ncbi:MAG: GNAT family protein, partial [Alphaproteobacteria bacterium]|nr:GNAT family protein [Alphaproteobacteria bacterium]